MYQHFAAPWSLRVKLFTAVFVLILGVAFSVAEGWGEIVILGILLGSLAFTVRGYSVGEGTVHIHRVGWAKQLDLSTLTNVYVSPDATIGARRTKGPEGLSGLYGWVRTTPLGTYRAYATNGAPLVVLEFGGETVVVTPDDPTGFVGAVERERATLA